MVGAKMGKKRGGFSFGDRMIWVLYAVVSIPVTFIALHAFNVEIQERAAIEQKGLEKVSTLSNLKREYVKTYENYLRLTRSKMNRYIPYYVEGRISEAQLKSYLNVNSAFVSGIDPNDIDASVRSYIGIEQMKFERADTSLFGDTQKYIDLQEGKIRNFSRLSINHVLTDLDEKLKESKSVLNDYLVEYAGGKRLTTNIDKAIEPTLIAQPMALFKKQLNPLSFVIILLIQGLMLLPYFMAPSRTYNKPKKPEGKSSDVVEW
jgi:hypothetical protein